MEHHLSLTLSCIYLMDLPALLEQLPNPEVVGNITEEKMCLKGCSCPWIRRLPRSTICAVPSGESEPCCSLQRKLQLPETFCSRQHLGWHPGGRWDKSKHQDTCQLEGRNRTQAKGEIWGRLSEPGNVLKNCWFFS